MIRARSFLLVVFVLAAAAPRVVSAQATTVILVRHAEKLAESGDPDLSAAGERRAEALSTVLADFPLEAIFVSQYRRTLQTAAPTATALGLTPVAIPITSGVPAQAAATAAAIRAMPAGSAALVVGHSNTLGAIIAALGGPAVGDLCDAEYATIFVVETAPASPVRLLRATYGAPDPPAAVACQRTMRQR